MCAKAREIRPGITFGADIIAGFPTEDDEMFANSLRLVEEAGIIFTHIFPYSKRDGTPAAKMPQVNGKVIKQRAKMLRDVGAQELQKFLHQQIGKKLPVILEKNNLGKAENFLDVKISGGQEINAGELVLAAIKSVEGNQLIGEVL